MSSDSPAKCEVRASTRCACNNYDDYASVKLSLKKKYLKPVHGGGQIIIHEFCGCLREFDRTRC